MYSKLTSLFNFIIAFITVLSLSNFSLNAQPDFSVPIRAIHMGGNWGRNPIQISEQPKSYYKFLERVNVNWAGISIALHIDNSLDDTVEKNYSENVQVSTFRDEPLRAAIRGFINNNIHVYLTLAIESQEASSSQYPVNRTQLGDPFAFNTDSNIKAENWPWNPPHPDHETFVQNFWESYAEEAKYFANIAEQEGVEMFSLGTETDRLFRTRVGGPFPNHFLNELLSVVDSVRSVYSGLVTYDMHYAVLEDTPVFSAGSDYLFQDLNLDAVGVSAYIKLKDQQPVNVMAVDKFKDSWRNIFNNYLTPLQNRNPNLPILFLEFGYVDAIGSAYLPSIEEFQNKVIIDNNNNSFDDGEEQQANIFEAFYDINEEFNRLVRGTFLWGNEISSDGDWNSSFGQMRTFSIRNKLSEDIISVWYELYKPDIAVPQLLYPENGAVDISINPELKWHSAPNVNSYSMRISELPDFSDNPINSPASSDTVISLEELSYNTTYYWQVISITSEGMSDWSEKYSFTTKEEPVIPLVAPELYYPANASENILINPELKWFRSEGADFYNLRVSDISDFSNVISNSPSLSDTVYILENLSYSTTYYWQVNSLNADGMSGWSEPFSFTTESKPLEPLSAPLLLYPENGADNISINLELKWLSSVNADYYNVRVSDQNDFSNTIYTSPSLSDTVLTIENLSYSTTYYWQVNSLNADGMSEWSNAFSFTTEMPTSINENIPYEYCLEQNYPNPFNPETIIKFTIGESENPSPYLGGVSVTLLVYDILGNEVSTLINKSLPEGNYEITFNGGKLNSGVYIYQIISGDFRNTKKMLLLK